ncbi:MAG: PAS domain S-box protein [Elusimicrobia bacterium]|nr:PAS domain S-box protein [Elusimicrobiota bacterium]
MTETPDPKLLWFNFLKVFTRGLVQINLYKPEHPQVRQALQEGEALLGQIADSLGGGEFSVTIDNDKLLINGVPLIASDKLPNSLRNLYSKFRLQTITFLPGANGDDLLALCQVQAFKGEAKAFLAEKGVERIKLNEAVYAKVDSGRIQPQPGVVAPGAGAGEGQGGGAGQGGAEAGPGGAGAGQGAEKVADKLAGQNFETALSTVVSRVTSDPAEQRRVVELLQAKFKEAVEAGVTRALEEVRREKKKVENDMVRTESVMTSIADGVVVVDKEGKILMMNPQAEAISGKPLAQLSGKKIVDLAQIENQVVSLAKEIKSDGRADVSREIAKAGSETMAETVKKSTAIIQNEDGKIVGAVSIPTDAAKMKQVEQLQQDFIANMTHELRSPLTSIKAALEIIGKDATPGDSSRGILNTAIRNTERLNSIITDILDFSKLQSGKMIFHQEGVPAAEVAREAAEAMRAWTSSKGVTLNVTVEPGVQHVYADRRRTVQVLINLISNAIKFTPQGGTIEVSADAGKESMEGFSFFSVKDTGCGIKKEDQGKIFEKFVQVAAGEKVGGTGLGLSITKAMVVMQGGRITLESEPGRGSTFRVALPVFKGQGEQQIFEQLPDAKPEARPWWKTLLGIK